MDDGWFYNGKDDIWRHVPCVCFEDGRLSFSTTILGMNLHCAENDIVGWKLPTVTEPSVIENETLYYTLNLNHNAQRRKCFIQGLIAQPDNSRAHPVPTLVLLQIITIKITHYVHECFTKSFMLVNIRQILTNIIGYTIDMPGK